MSDKIELNRRRVLSGLVTIGAAGAAVGAGTFAAFSDTEESSDNTIVAGTLDLTDGNDSDVPHEIVDVSGMAPGKSETITQTLGNGGNVAGHVVLTIDSVSESGGDHSEPEQDAGDTDNAADLGDFLDLDFIFDGESQWDGKASALPEGQSIDLGTLAGTTEKDFVIEAGIPATLDEVDGHSDFNVIQGDSVTIDAIFTLNQQ